MPVWAPWEIFNVTLAPAGLNRTPSFECASHPYRGPGCPGRVPVADEREEQCVAPEAEQVTALVVCFAQEVGECSEEDLGEFLRASLALFRELLRELREARHVGEHERPVQ